MTFKVQELRGYKSLRAFNAFHTIMIGVKMLPAYQAETYESFFQLLEAMSPVDQEKVIRLGVMLVELQQDEVEAITAFCLDPNGIPYQAANLKNLKPDELFEMIVAVLVEISKIKINFVSESEKKS